MSKKHNIDYLVIGGGFYGCCLSLFLRSISESIMLVESEDQILTQASKVNQARIHTGFHYPRNAVTAVKSMMLHKRFINDFPEAVIDNFQMLYAISRRRSKISAKRFFKMFSDLGSPISQANAYQSSLFSSTTIEEVFECSEYAFDYSIIREHLSHKINKIGVNLKLNSEVVQLEEKDDCVIVKLCNGSEICARYVFNVTYSGINHILDKAKLPKAKLKYELTELAIVQPPPEIEGFGITVMDGPFFSLMPFPTKNYYSLTHVRYTPHRSWTDDYQTKPLDDEIKYEEIESKFKYMILDGQRYVPCLSASIWKESLYAVKTLLLKNEQDDGRPILYQRDPNKSNVISIMGGKFDNIYDLFELIKVSNPDWSRADDRYIF